MSHLRMPSGARWVSSRRALARSTASCVVCLLAVGLASVVASPKALGLPDDPWPYEWPVDVVVVDGFRPPQSPYGPGNRGLEFGTAGGEEVRAAGAGVVVFAGQVGGRLHVTTAHPDRLRVSFSRLSAVVVRVGQRVAKGEVIGTAAAGLHVGVRLGDAYLDPAVVFGGRRLVRLVPDGVPASPVRVRLHARTAAAGASAVRIATLARWSGTRQIATASAGSTPRSPRSDIHGARGVGAVSYPVP